MKFVRQFIIPMVIVLLICCAGYCAGHRDGEIEAKPDRTQEIVNVQKSKDSLASFNYNKTADSLIIENKALEKANALILTSINHFKNELKTQEKRIDYVTDSSLYLIVDSILRAEYE